MPIALLHRMACEDFPFVVEGEVNVSHVHTLVLAGHLKAVFPPLVYRGPGIEDRLRAVVMEITPLGRQMLQCFPLVRRESMKSTASRSAQPSEKQRKNDYLANLRRGLSSIFPVRRRPAG